MTRSQCLSSSFLGAHKQNKTKGERTPTHLRFLWVHKNKTKEDNDERRFIIVFFGCIETKQKKMMTNIDLSLSSLGAQKKKTKKKSTTNVDLSLSSFGA
jgi:hypothetical protein